MNITATILADKIREIHPALDRHGIALHVTFDNDKDAWIVRLRKDGIECVHLGVQIGQFINYYCDGPVAACAA
ncbi:hypothetical protein [Nitratidesulfovibrio termitidis]|uniref:hypothetical protein n=1 Tax=Nitratidesulfovibrio termitidis TaxID=42252 RepID=UPI00040C29D9|nr:hypothetical protein [Nitratidesulfovibrio termitidis]